MIRSIRYEIIKPVGTTWQDFGMVLNDLRYTSARIANYTVQKLWEWDNFRWKYKLEVNEFPDNKSKPNIYRLSRERFPEVGCSVISRTMFRRTFLTSLNEQLPLLKLLVQVTIPNGKTLKNAYISAFQVLIQKLHVTSTLHTQRAFSQAI